MDRTKCFLSFGRFKQVLQLRWAKKGGVFLAPNNADLGGHLSTWGMNPGAPSISFWLKSWIWQSHHVSSKMAGVE